ncbi:MAG: ilvD 8 [Firmicutes bacterium]|nr:ilvD 8 [Bacillota bacterium]
MKSNIVKQGTTRAAHRSLFYAMGYRPEDLEKPLIGIVNSFNEIVPGHFHLREITEAVKLGVAAAGGTPVEFPAIGICDGIAMGHEGMKYSLASRELIADSTESMAMAHAFDGLVLIPNCDKIIPGMLMAAARLNIPSVVVSGGPMLAGRYDGKDVSLSSMFEAAGLFEAGKISAAEMDKMEHAACPGCGSCSGLFTANTMNCLTEALGLGLPGNGTIPAAYSGARRALAKNAGAVVVDLVAKNICPRDILTMQAFENAITVDMGIGGSSNTVLHLPAIAHEVGLELPLELFDKISARTPYITKLSPGGVHHLQDLDEAGGIPAVMKELAKAGLVHTEALTVTGKVAERIENAGILRKDVIRTTEDPYRKTGGIAILKGNLAPDGAVVKESAVAEEMLAFEGTARVFDSEDAAIEAILAKKIKDGDVIVIRYACIGHISPEAAEGGTLALVEEGDIISIDILQRELNVKVSEQTLASRKAAWVKPPLRITKGYLARYAKLVTSANTGAVLK